ncbi:MAG TPA: hypothetical protein VFK33_00040 [Bacillales bacterium]|nr:hypothetical protein [Bacillales bacterium]
MTENEEKFLELIKEKANSLDERAEKFEEHLRSIETEMQEIKHSLAYVKHKIGEHDEKIFHLSDFQKKSDPDVLGDIKRDLTFLTEKAAKTERDIFDLKKKL